MGDTDADTPVPPPGPPPQYVLQQQQQQQQQQQVLKLPAPPRKPPSGASPLLRAVTDGVALGSSRRYTISSPVDFSFEGDNKDQPACSTTTTTTTTATATATATEGDSEEIVLSDSWSLSSIEQLSDGEDDDLDADAALGVSLDSAFAPPSKLGGGGANASLPPRLGFIDQIENMAWRQSMQDMMQNVPLTARSERAQQQQKQASEFIYLYESGSALRTMSMGLSHDSIKTKTIQRTTSSASLTRHAVTPSRVRIVPNNPANPVPLLRRTSSDTKMRASLGNHSDAAFNAFPPPASPTPDRVEPTSPSSESHPKVQLPIAPMTASEPSLVLGRAAAATAAVTLIEPLAKLALETDSPATVVNAINFRNPIKLTPRRSHTITVSNLNEATGSRASHNFLDYALAHFATGKTKNSKLRAKMKKRISAAKKPLSMPLHPFSSNELRAIAISNFDKIMLYCQVAGTPGSEERGLEIAQEILRTGLEMATLRDEIYCQLIKQASNNKYDRVPTDCLVTILTCECESRKNAARVWELIAFCLGCFLPSNTLDKYLQAFLHEQSQVEGEIGEWARYCLDRVEKALQTSKRLFVPVLRELSFVQKRKPMNTSFFFVDGRQKTIPIYSSTNAHEALEFLCHMLSLADHQGYSVFEHYSIKNNVTAKSTYTERSLMKFENVPNALGKFELFSSAYSADPTVTATAKLVVKRKLFLTPNVLSEDPVENRLLYYQACDDIHRCTLPCSIEDAEILAALRLQAEFSDFDEDKFAKHEKLVLEDYLPETLMALYPSHPWMQLIKHQYATMTGMKAEEARTYYLQYCQELPLYGFHLFVVEHREDASVWHMPKQFRVAVNVSGIYFIALDSPTIYHSFMLSEVVTHHATPKLLILTFQSASISLRFEEADEFISLFLDYKYHALKAATATAHALPV